MVFCIFLYIYNKRCKEFNLERKIKPMIICLIVIHAIAALLQSLISKQSLISTLTPIEIIFGYFIMLLLEIAFLLYYRSYCKRNNKVLNFITIAIVIITINVIDMALGKIFG